MSHLQKVTRLDAVDAVAEQLRNHIIQGHFDRGGRMPPEITLAEELGVSRNTVREALRALEAQGWVRRSKAGTEVLRHDSELLRQSLDSVAQLQQLTVAELFEVRRVLECEMAAIAAVRGTAEQKAAILREGTVPIPPDISEGDFAEQNVRFHKAIAMATQNRLLQVLFPALRSLLVKVQRAGGMRPELRDVAVVDHRQIAEAIVSGDADAARTAMSEHLTHIEKGLDPDFLVEAAIRIDA